MTLSYFVYHLGIQPGGHNLTENRKEGRADYFRMPPCFFPSTLIFCVMIFYDFIAPVSDVEV